MSGKGRFDPPFICSVCEALEAGDEVLINRRSRPIEVLGYERQDSPGLIGGSDYPYHILWLRGNGTEYRLRWSHLGEYAPHLHTESELQTRESYSVKHGETRLKTHPKPNTGERVSYISVVGVDDERLSGWALDRLIDGETAGLAGTGSDRDE